MEDAAAQHQVVVADRFRAAAVAGRTGPPGTVEGGSTGRGALQLAALNGAINLVGSYVADAMVRGIYADLVLQGK